MRLITVASVVIALAAESTSAGIGIFADPSGSQCNVTVLPFTPVPVYVLYLGQGGPQANGAQYRITGMPGRYNLDYAVNLIIAPGSILNLGHAFDGAGHAVAFATAQPFDGNGNLLLATYQIIIFNPATVPVAGTILRVERWNQPLNPAFPCPLITFAGGPDGYMQYCQNGGEMRVNGGPTCTVSVDEQTWTAIRKLYR